MPPWGFSVMAQPSLWFDPLRLERSTGTKPKSIVSASISTLTPLNRHRAPLPSNGTPVSRFEIGSVADGATHVASVYSWPSGTMYLKATLTIASRVMDIVTVGMQPWATFRKRPPMK